MSQLRVATSGAPAGAVGGTTSLAAVDKWRHFDLVGLQDSADNSAAEIAKWQEDSESSRSRLIEFSKEFRQTAPDDVRRQVQPLLKSFQTEVDSLLKRSKAAESAFLSIYRTIRELPDPAALISCVDRLDEKDSENSRLRDSMAEVNKQLALAKTHDEERLRRAEAEMEEKMWHSVQEQLSVELTERQAEWAEERSALERRLLDTEGQVGILRRELDKSMKARTATGAAVSTDSGKTALLAEELERANQRALTAEYKVMDLQQQVAALQRQADQSANENSVPQSPNRSSFREQQTQQESVQRLRDELDRLKTSYQTQFNRLEDQLSAANSQNATLQAKLDGQRDYAEIKQQVALLKAAYDAECGPADSLESVLLARNRRLESENAALRVRETDLSESLEKLRWDFSQQSLVVQEQKSLTERLENDLYQLKELMNPALSDPLSNLVGSSPDFVNDALRSKNAHLASALPASPTGGPPEPDSTVYSGILERQLARFHAKTKELEGVCSEQHSQLMALKGQLEAAKADNVGLYERIRFLQSYDGRKHKETAAALGRGHSTDVESRYAVVYEDNLDPFSKFHRTERLRKYQLLNPVDKATLAMGQMVLGSSRGRKSFFIYALILHLLVFGILYKLALSESNLRDYSYDCATRFAEHMHKEHHT
ncbi:protein CASP-like [Paramacrobiotus metropolitanus]|uniref:protein CASP-like n=1 Tax=Paramacrobiotus metropolitanus TaxID=2943436 RepID=UPI002445BC41|nr:protein CASP-like [Paramacrobiotus metropolitanus]XP_055343490.1 protein CASP-like [Paramacrobiotus metropolitanus]